MVTHVTESEMMFELATWLGVKWRSSLIVAVNYQSSVSVRQRHADCSIRGVIRRKTDGLAYQGWKCVPSPKCYHEAKPGEKENSSVDIDGV